MTEATEKHPVISFLILKGEEESLKVKERMEILCFKYKFFFIW